MMNKQLEDHISWLRSANLEAKRQAEIFTKLNLVFSADCSCAMAMAYKLAMENAELLLNSDERKTAVDIGPENSGNAM